MNYSSLEDVYGGVFGQRQPVTHARKDIKETMENPPHVPEFTPMTSRATASVEKNKDLIASVTKTLPLDTSPSVKNAGVERRMAVQEHFSRPLQEGFSTLASQPAGVFDDMGAGQQSEKLSRILRLIEQNRTGYERPALQDMALYIATGVLFLFTFDTFVSLGRSMRRG